MKILMSRDWWQKQPHCPKEFPTERLNENHAKSIHGQSLSRLDQRGGMGPEEIIGNYYKATWNSMQRLDRIRCIHEIIRLLEPNSVDLNKGA